MLHYIKNEGVSPMERTELHKRVWRVLYAIADKPVHRIFALQSEPVEVDAPCIVISNHVTDLDPFLVAMSFPEKQLYYVASEHIFRLPVASKIITTLLDPIARKKGDSGFGAVREILRRVKQGHSICLFAEGDCTWDGRTGSIPPATGKMVRSSGAALVTYRLEGGYFTSPRWGRGLRRGEMRGHPIGVYPPEALRKMKGKEITALIERDIFEDAWARQKEHPVHYETNCRAERLEIALFLCPECRRVGTLRSNDDTLRCTCCGSEVRMRGDYTFAPGAPFPTVAEWDAWQHEALRAGNYVHGETLFSDPVCAFSRILPEHRTEKLTGTELVQRSDALHCGGMTFPLREIENMAIVQKRLLLFTCAGHYYTVKCAKGANLRKYLALWKAAHEEA